MDKIRISLVYSFCGLIIAGAIVLCFLPTVFYMNPVPRPDETIKGSSLQGNTSQQTPFVFIPSFPCNSPLILHNESGYCKPPCDWMPYTDQKQNAMAITDWITVVFCTISFFLLLITWLKIPEFMRFPHIIILLMAGSGAFIELLVLIPKFSKRSSFFCSSTFLDEAAENPTSFCQFQGALIHYMSLVTGELFVIYNVMLLKNLVIDKLPNYGYDNRQLIILSLLSTLLPIIPVIFVLKSDENYVAVYFRYCFPQDKQMSFYSCILPLQIFLSIGITCLLIVIFKLIKERKTSLIGCPSQAKTRQLKLQKAAFGFITVIISYITCVFLTYGLICMQLNNREAYKETLINYFKCLIFTQDCPKDFLNYQPPYGLLVLSFLAGSVFQAGTIVLLAGKTKARTLWLSWLRCFGAKKCGSIKKKHVPIPSNDDKKSCDTSTV